MLSAGDSSAGSANVFVTRLLSFTTSAFPEIGVPLPATDQLPARYVLRMLRRTSDCPRMKEYAPSWRDVRAGCRPGALPSDISEILSKARLGLAPHR